MEKEQVTITKKNVALKTPTEKGGIVRPRKKSTLDVQVHKEHEETEVSETEEIVTVSEVEAAKQKETESLAAMEEVEETKQEESDSQVALEETSIEEAKTKQQEQAEALEEISLDEFEDVKSEVGNTRTTTAGAMSIISSKRNGKRCTFSKSVISSIKHPETIQVKMSKNKLLIGNNLGGTQDFPLRKQKSKSVIYSAALVDELTEHYNLDFSDRVSITFPEVKYGAVNGSPVAIITINEEEVTE